MQKLTILSLVFFVAIIFTGCAQKNIVENQPVKESSKEDVDMALRIIEVDAQRFRYTPSEIRVKKGEKVALHINNIDTPHEAQFSDMEVYYEENGNILLDTSTPGTYIFGCAVYCGEGHTTMSGVIIVE